MTPISLKEIWTFDLAKSAFTEIRWYVLMSLVGYSPQSGRNWSGMTRIWNQAQPNSSSTSVGWLNLKHVWKGLYRFPRLLQTSCRKKNKRTSLLLCTELTEMKELLRQGNWRGWWCQQQWCWRSWRWWWWRVFRRWWWWSRQQNQICFLLLYSLFSSSLLVCYFALSFFFFSSSWVQVLEMRWDQDRSGFCGYGFGPWF